MSFRCRSSANRTPDGGGGVPASGTPASGTPASVPASGTPPSGAPPPAVPMLVSLKSSNQVPAASEVRPAAPEEVIACGAASVTESLSAPSMVAVSVTGPVPCTVNAAVAQSLRSGMPLGASPSTLAVPDRHLRIRMRPFDSTTRS